MSILVEHLFKSYGKQLVLNDINFSIGTGEIVAFLGNNGAGKSTTMKIITGYLTPDSGRVEVCGIDVQKNPLEAHRCIGYLPEHNPIYPEMYVKEYLSFIAGVYKLGKTAGERVDEMIEKTGLTREYKKKIGMLSKGYRQRVGLAQALIPNPDVLILDEPTTGLDPNQIVGVRDLIKEVGKEKTVMLSTHIMQEVSAICDRVIIINRGKVAVDDKETMVLSSVQDHRLSIFVEYLQPTDASFLKEIPGVEDVQQSTSNQFVLMCKEDVREQVFKHSVENQQVILTLKLQERSMEDVFRTVTK
ncbi:MAG: ATP-binding cassette domain-containing protein [Bacteroidales bacterium]|nr:ATP-binding cassette domain-containing protein [Bacteroidales bacterium]